jgi:transglutaminase-like putative cysteine protease
MVYDVKQFRPVLYLVILTALTGFAMAAESEGLWVISTLVLGLNAFLVFRGHFKPIPKLLATVVATLAAIYPILELRNKIGSPIIAVGQYLVVVLLVKIWEQRSNRDYMYALLLSLLLMVAAAISTGSLLFGVLFITFLFLSLYCCLLFHLKAETEEARSMLGLIPADRSVAGTKPIDESALRQNEKHLFRSMRRLTGMVAVYSIVCAVAVFLLFPRGTGAGMFGQIQWRSRDTLTGFNPQVGYQEVARLAQSNEPVATVKIYRDGQIMTPEGSLYLRGLTHEYYNGREYSNVADSSRNYQWGAGPRMATVEPEPMFDDGGIWRSKESARDRDRDRPGSPFKTHYRQQVDLNPTGTTALFSLAGATSLRFEEGGNSKRVKVVYSPRDTTIGAADVVTQPLRYEVSSTGKLGNKPTPNPHRSRIDPQITAMARLPAVSGTGLVEQREAYLAQHPFGTTPFDRQIAEHISDYLRTQYRYTLDLTQLADTRGRDPIVAFLYDFKKGHCQYFAGAMTLLCQSLGMDARLVVGFKCDDFNDYGQFFDVRSSDAHTWVEVLTADGWQTFDPTSGAGDEQSASQSAWQRAKKLFDYLEYTWQNSVISYDGENRDNLIQSMDTKLNQTAVKSAGQFSDVTERLGRLGDWLATRVVGPLVALLVTAIVGLIGWYLFDRWKLRRRARRIGVDSLPAQDQAKLLRQLGFYDDLLQLLERHQIIRPAQLTPLEFSRSLSYVPGDAYDVVRRLTQLYYRIRYGRSEIDDAQQRRLARVVARLSDQMSPRPAYE